jgi:TPR repeat protein
MKHSETVAVAIDKIWKSYDKEQMWEGYELLRQAAEKGDADACCYLGRCYLGEEFVWCGAEFPVDEELASRLIKESVRLGSADGVLCALRTGNLSPAVQKTMPFASLEEAFTAVIQRAQEGDAFSQYMVGNVLFYGDYLVIRGDEERRKYNSEDEYYAFAYPIATQYYENSFDNGLPAAFGNYRTIYESGLADIDEEVYENYLKQLADTGDPLTCNDYGKLLEDEYDDAEGAFHYYSMAVERGDVQSAYNVAVCYGTGYGVDEDLDKAFENYMIAAEAGNAKAQFQIGNFYFEGRGNIAQDYAKAVVWLNKAYQNMDAEDSWQPAAELAVCYQNGLGTFQDDDAAFELLSEIEENDMLDEVWEPLDAMVLNALGVAYGFGRGTKQDIPQAIEYFDRAIEYDSDEAKRNKACFKKTLFGGWKMR